MFIFKSHRSCSSIDAGRLLDFFVAFFLILTAFVSFVIQVLIILPNNGPFWDEAWTLSVAKSLLEHNHYGLFFMGQPDSPGLSASPPIVTIAWIGLKIFGTSFIGGRIAFAFLALLFLILVFAIGKSLHSWECGLFTVLNLTLFYSAPDLSLAMHGSMVMAEVPMLLFLFFGFYCFLNLSNTIKHSYLVWFIPISWSIAIWCKIALAPFFVTGAALTASFSALRRNFREAWLVFWTAALSVVLASIWIFFQIQFGLIAKMPEGYVSSMLETIAAVLDIDVRFAALKYYLVWSGFSFVSSLIVLHCIINMSRQIQRSYNTRSIPTMLFLMTIGLSWSVWYVALAYPFPRYLFPAYVILAPFGGIFFAELLFELRRATNTKIRPSLGIFNLVPFQKCIPLVILAVAIYCLRGIYLSFLVRDCIKDNLMPPFIEVSQYLSQKTDASDILETIDSEILFAVSRKFSFPAPDVHVRLNKRTFLHKSVEIGYDPMAFNPNYLVIGPFGRMWALYDSTVRNLELKPVFENSKYQVYKLQ